MVGCETVYQDDIFFTPFNRPELRQEGFTKINANIRFTTPDEKWILNLWGKNLTDETVYIGSFILNGSLSNLDMLAPPRTFGVTVGCSYKRHINRVRWLLKTVLCSSHRLRSYRPPYNASCFFVPLYHTHSFTSQAFHFDPVRYTHNIMRRLIH